MFYLFLLLSFALFGCNKPEKTGNEPDSVIALLSTGLGKSSAAGFSSTLIQAWITDVVDRETIAVKTSEQENKTVRLAGIEIPNLPIPGQPFREAKSTPWIN